MVGMLAEIGCVSVENCGVVPGNDCGSIDLNSVRASSPNRTLFLGKIEERSARIGAEF